MFTWKKLGRIFDPTKVEGIDWMKEFSQAPSVLIFDDFVRVYFSCRPPADENGKYISRAGFVDLDRKDLTKVINVSKKPILELGNLGCFDEFGTNPTSVIKDKDDIRIYYCGWTRCESVPFNGAIGVAISHDNGETFDKLGDGPVLSYSLDEPFILGSPKIRKFGDTWYLWYVSGRKWLNKEGSRPEPIYKIRMATSLNGLDWVKFGKNIIEDRIDGECQASPDVTYAGGKYHMFFSYRHTFNFKEAGRGYLIGYAYSNDLKTWHRDDSKAGITTSKEGWDSEMVSYSHVFELDGNTYMLYQGNQLGRFGFGLAVLEGELS